MSDSIELLDVEAFLGRAPVMDVQIDDLGTEYARAAIAQELSCPDWKYYDLVNHGVNPIDALGIIVISGKNFGKISNLLKRVQAL